MMKKILSGRRFPGLYAQPTGKIHVNSLQTFDMSKEYISEAAIPNPALEGFKPFIGHWKTEGVHPLVPDIVFHGQTSFDWLENGAFVIVHSSIDEDQIPTGIAIIGSDDAGQLYMLYFDERKVSRKYDVSLQGKELKWWRNTPAFSQTSTLVMADSRETIVGHGEMSRESGPWEKDLSLTYFRLAD